MAATAASPPFRDPGAAADGDWVAGGGGGGGRGSGGASRKRGGNVKATKRKREKSLQKNAMDVDPPKRANTKKLKSQIIKKDMERDRRNKISQCVMALKDLIPLHPATEGQKMKQVEIMEGSVKYVEEIKPFVALLMEENRLLRNGFVSRGLALPHGVRPDALKHPMSKKKTIDHQMVRSPFQDVLDSQSTPFIPKPETPKPAQSQPDKPVVEHQMVRSPFQDVLDAQIASPPSSLSRDKAPLAVNMSMNISMNPNSTEVGLHSPFSELNLGATHLPNSLSKSLSPLTIPQVPGSATRPRRIHDVRRGARARVMIKEDQPVQHANSPSPSPSVPVPIPGTRGAPILPHETRTLVERAIGSSHHLSDKIEVKKRGPFFQYENSIRHQSTAKYRNTNSSGVSDSGNTRMILTTPPNNIGGTAGGAAGPNGAGRGGRGGAGRGAGVAGKGDLGRGSSKDSTKSGFQFDGAAPTLTPGPHDIEEVSAWPLHLHPNPEAECGDPSCPNFAEQPYHPHAPGTTFPPQNPDSMSDAHLFTIFATDPHGSANQSQQNSSTQQYMMSLNSSQNWASGNSASNLYIRERTTSGGSYLGGGGGTLSGTGTGGTGSAGGLNANGGYSLNTNPLMVSPMISPLLLSKFDKFESPKLLEKLYPSDRNNSYTKFSPLAVSPWNAMGKPQQQTNTDYMATNDGTSGSGGGGGGGGGGGVGGGVGRGRGGGVGTTGKKSDLETMDGTGISPLPMFALSRNNSSGALSMAMDVDDASPPPFLSYSGSYDDNPFDRF